MELWALLAISAPGLFPDSGRFTEYYRTPIERGEAPIGWTSCAGGSRPFLLRRTKEQVATDLPAKQEQVIELDLSPRHQQVYQRHLQRERQKILGLIGTDVVGRQPVPDPAVAHPAPAAEPGPLPGRRGVPRTSRPASWRW